MATQNVCKKVNKTFSQFWFQIYLRSLKANFKKKKKNYLKFSTFCKPFSSNDIIQFLFFREYIQFCPTTNYEEYILLPFYIEGIYWKNIMTIIGNSIYRSIISSLIKFWYSLNQSESPLLSLIFFFKKKKYFEFQIDFSRYNVFLYNKSTIFWCYFKIMCSMSFRWHRNS